MPSSTAIPTSADVHDLATENDVWVEPWLAVEVMLVEQAVLLHHKERRGLRGTEKRFEILVVARKRDIVWEARG